VPKRGFSLPAQTRDDLRRLIDLAGTTQAELAKSTAGEISQAWISNLLTGENVRDLAKVQRFADTLSVLVRARQRDGHLNPTQERDASRVIARLLMDSGLRRSRVVAEMLAPEPTFLDSTLQSDYLGSAGRPDAEPSRVTCLAWSPNRLWSRAEKKYTEYLAIGGEPGHILRLSVDSPGLSREAPVVVGRPTVHPNAHEGATESLAWSPDGDYLISGGRDEHLKMWIGPNSQDEDIRQTKDKFDDTVGCYLLPGSAALLRIQDAGESLCLSQSGYVISFKSLADGDPLSNPTRTGVFLSAAANREGTLVYLGHPNGRISAIDLRLAGARPVVRPLCYPPPNSGDVSSLALSLDGALLYAGYLDGIVRVWNADPDSEEYGMRVAQTDEAHDGRVTALSIACTGNILASGGDNGSVKLWQIDLHEGGLPIAGRPMDELYGHDHVTSLAFSRTGEYLACGVAQGRQARVVLWWVWPATPFYAIRRQQWLDYARQPLAIVEYPANVTGEQQIPDSMMSDSFSRRTA